LHGDRCFLQCAKDPWNGVFDGPHDKAIKQGDIVVGAGAGLDPAARQELVILQNSIEATLPA
jgi:hypothetical protein